MARSVKKRKKVKRSASPSAPAGRMMLYGAGIGLGAFLVSVFIAGFVAVSTIKSFLRSDKLRDLVVSETAQMLRADADLQRLTWEGTTAYTDGYEAQGYEDAAFSHLRIAGFRAQVDASMENLRRGVWEIEEVKINQLDLGFSPDQRLSGTFENSNPPEVLTPAEEEKAKKKEAGLFASLIPSEVEVVRARIANTNLFFDGDNPVAATGIQSVIEPTSAEGSWHVRTHGGIVQAENWPKIQLGSLDFRWQGDEFYVSEASMELLDGARLDLDGDFSLGEEGSMIMRARLKNLDAAHVFNETWKRRIKGIFSVDAKITGHPERLSGSVQKGTVTLEKGVIEALPVLDLLADYTNSDRFRRLALNHATADFTRQGGEVEIRNIHLQSDGLARLEGGLDIDHGQLSGQLNLGVIPGTLSWIPGAERKVFTENRDGHLWTVVNVSGTVKDPEHDLTGRLAAGAVEAIVEGAPQAVKDTAEDVVKDPGSVIEKGRETFDLGKELLEGLFK